MDALDNVDFVGDLCQYVIMTKELYDRFMGQFRQGLSEKKARGYADTYLRSVINSKDPDYKQMIREFKEAYINALVDFAWNNPELRDMAFNENVAFTPLVSTEDADEDFDNYQKQYVRTVVSNLNTNTSKECSGKYYTYMRENNDYYYLFKLD